MPDWGGLVEDIRRAATPAGRARTGQFAIEGLRLHERALRAGTPPTQVLVGAGLLGDKQERVARLLDGLQAAGCSIEPAPDEVLSSLMDGRSTGALAGLVPIPRPVELSEVLEPALPAPAMLLVGVDVEDPGNVGALVRTALASGVRAFVAAGRTDPFHPKAVRTSMGSLFKLPILRDRSVEEWVIDLSRRGVRRVGAVTTSGCALPALAFDGRPVALFLGSEAFGLDPETRKIMDDLATVPMAEGVDSLSVNAAAAILLYEIRRGVVLAREGR